MKITMSDNTTYSFDTKNNELEKLLVSILNAYGYKPEKPENAEPVAQVKFYADDGADVTELVVTGRKRPPIKHIYVSDDVHGKTVAAHYFPDIANETVAEGGDLFTWDKYLCRWLGSKEWAAVSDYHRVSWCDYYEIALHNIFDDGVFTPERYDELIED